PNFIGGYGMSWFPGYAINVETGERLNMAFGEDSWMQGQNGRDMIWNPTYDITKGPFDNARLGGKHYIFVFRNNVVEDFPNVTRSEFKPLGEGDFARVGTHVTIASRQMPSYDYGSFMFSKLQSAAITDQISRTEAVKKFNLELTDVYRAAMWVSLPLLREGHSLKSMTDGIIPNQTTVNLRVNSPFRGYPTGRSFDVGTVLEEDWYFVNRGPVKYGDHIYQRGEYFWANGAEELLDGSNGNTDVQDLKANVLQSINAGRPTYFFNTHDISTLKADRNTLVDALNCIGVVPNPYYAYSQYEESKLDHEIKIINLPDEAHIKIFTASGILVRELVKSDPNKTSISWDLKNSANIDVSSGLYLVHVNVPGIGQRVLKWYGMMRPIDLDNF
ncbi:MAG: hypothetical protein MRY83_10815, partial [Flavobacteriales bacterium]|nr:hypothetical protein [Flavobacteriales bacterium]